MERMKSEIICVSLNIYRRSKIVWSRKKEREELFYLVANQLNNLVHLAVKQLCTERLAKRISGNSPGLFFN